MNLMQKIRELQLGAPDISMTLQVAFFSERVTKLIPLAGMQSSEFWGSWPLAF